MRTIEEKYQMLRENLRALGSAAVAFSSGVDSTFLLRVAHDVLGERVLAVTAASCLFPAREREEAAAFCAQNRIRQVVCKPEQPEEFWQNPKNRCYLCKRRLFEQIRQIAQENGMNAVVEGSNADDEGDYRPGMIAVAELGVKSPLREAGLTKAEIRQLSKQLGLPTWDKPSFACLASRFVYGETISEEKLAMVGKAEQRLLELGFRQVRVRIHTNLARIEIDPSEFPKLVEQNRVAELHRYLRRLGFAYVTLDLGGYETGSMNRTL